MNYIDNETDFNGIYGYGNEYLIRESLDGRLITGRKQIWGTIKLSMEKGKVIHHLDKPLFSSIGGSDLREKSEFRDIVIQDPNIDSDKYSVGCIAEEITSNCDFIGCKVVGASALITIQVSNGTIGGLVGSIYTYSSNLINVLFLGCESDVSIKQANDSINIANVGGIVGNVSNTSLNVISCVRNSGTFTDAHITNAGGIICNAETGSVSIVACKNYSDIIATDYAAGIVAGVYNSNTSILNNANLGDVTSNYYASGIISRAESYYLNYPSVGIINNNSNYGDIIGDTVSGIVNFYSMTGEIVNNVVEAGCELIGDNQANGIANNAQAVGELKIANNRVFCKLVQGEASGNPAHNIIGSLMTESYPVDIVSNCADLDDDGAAGRDAGDPVFDGVPCAIVDDKDTPFTDGTPRDPRCANQYYSLSTGVPAPISRKPRGDGNPARGNAAIFANAVDAMSGVHSGVSSLIKTQTCLFEKATELGSDSSDLAKFHGNIDQLSSALTSITRDTGEVIDRVLGVIDAADCGDDCDCPAPDDYPRYRCLYIPIKSIMGTSIVNVPFDIFDGGGNKIESTTSNSFGELHLTDLTAGTYVIKPSAGSGFKSVDDMGTIIVVDDDGNVTASDISGGYQTTLEVDENALRDKANAYRESSDRMRKAATHSSDDLERLYAMMDEAMNVKTNDW